MKTDTNHLCLNCSNKFTLTNEDYNFLDKFKVPPPKCCPECRQQRRLASNNEMNLYHRTCDLSGEKIISNYSSDKPYKVYACKAWWSKEWDACDYGKDYDFSRPFFEQYADLLKAVPHDARRVNYLLDENSDFTNYAGSNKDCYLIFHADNNRDCFYGYGIKFCTSSSDCYNLFDSELCYQSIDCKKCYNLKYSQNCINCYDSYFLNDCIGCKNCIACKNLVQKEFYIFNKQYTKKEYQNFLQKNNFGSNTIIEKISNEHQQLCSTLPYRNLRMIQTEDCFGDQLIECKNVTNSFDIANLRDGRYCYQLYNNTKDFMDVYQFGLNSELVYESSIVGYNANNIKFCHSCTEQVSDLSYSQLCYHSSSLFGCFAMRHKQHCILNKSYNKHEYEQLIPKIIAQMKETGEYGEFFPIIHSPFAYNESMAQLYYPLTKEECLAKGYQWKEEEVEIKYQGNSPQVPDSIQEATEDITKQIFSCETTNKHYKIIPQEFKFYKNNNIPLPTKCFNQRHKDRLAKRNPRKIIPAKCNNCQKEILSTQDPQAKRIVYCGECFEAVLE